MCTSHPRGSKTCASYVKDPEAADNEDEVGRRDGMGLCSARYGAGEIGRHDPEFAAVRVVVVCFGTFRAAENSALVMVVGRSMISECTLVCRGVLYCETQYRSPSRW